MMNEKPVVQFDDGWAEIKSKALIPLEQKLDEGFKGGKSLFLRKEYVEIYTLCYDMCCQRSPYNCSQQLYEKHGTTIADYLHNSVLPALKDKTGEFLLAELVRRDINHKIMNRWMKNFFTYLDRFYVKYARELPTLAEAGNKIFKTIVFDSIKQATRNSIIRLIDSERDGNDVNGELIRSAVRIFEDMGLGTLNEYTVEFEDQFLLASTDYFRRKSEEWIQGDSLPAYLLKAEKFIAEERIRVSKYLHYETEAKLLDVFDREMLEKRQVDLIEKEGSGFKAMLVNDMLDDLARLFRLFSRLTDSLSPIADVLKQHIIDCGEEKIQQRLGRIDRSSSNQSIPPNPSSAVIKVPKESSASNTDKEEKESGEKDNVVNDDPQFIKDLLSVHDKYLRIVNDQFNGNAAFQKALKDAFVDIVNRDVGKAKTADLIGLFCDRLLKAGTGDKLSDSEIEDYLERCVQLFSYLNDKDLFAEIYRNLLSKRLLSQRSASDEMERLMISKLKLRCGAQFTAKMEGMLTDLTIGSQSATSFANYCKENETRLGLGKIEFSVQVLTAGYWPTFKNIEAVNLGATLSRCCQVFKEYYDAHTTHRKLSWVHILGNVNMKASFNRKSYDLQISVLQAVVLMTFNVNGAGVADNDGTRSFETIATVTNLQEDILKRVLHSLACGKVKVIKKLTATGSSSSVVKPSDVFQFNESFASNLRKIRIPMASLEDTHSLKKVEEDRSLIIEASIVRIMKARKTFHHQQLVAEVLAQLSFFKPDPKVVKRRIEALIDREYLEREPDSQNVYRYLA